MLCPKTTDRARVSKSVEQERELSAQRSVVSSGWVGLKICAAIAERRRDLDNLNKALVDLVVEHRVIEDDALVASIEARWDKTIPSGRVRLETTAQGTHRRRHAQTHQGGEHPAPGHLRAGRDRGDVMVWVAPGRLPADRLVHLYCPGCRHYLCCDASARTQYHSARA